MRPRGPLPTPPARSFTSSAQQPQDPDPGVPLLSRALLSLPDVALPEAPPLLPSSPVLPSPATPEGHLFGKTPGRQLERQVPQGRAAPAS